MKRIYLKSFFTSAKIKEVNFRKEKNRVFEGIRIFTAVQNKLKEVFKIGIRPQKHKRSDRIYF